MPPRMNEPPLSDLLEAYARTREPELMARLVEGYLPLSAALARKFTGRGVELEDLEQVAAMALMKAIERFEPERGLRFSTYAMPTIAGALRNHIRDQGGALRLSRDVRAGLSKLYRTQEALTRQLRREPSLREIAEAMGVTHDELLMLLDARESAETVSVQAEEEDGTSLEARLGVPENGYERVEQRAWMDWVFSLVTPTEKRLLELRFIERLGQRDTARALGVSQMRVSRMERRILARLREETEPWQESPGSAR